jgi:hypothetical protein
MSRSRPTAPAKATPRPRRFVKLTGLRRATSRTAIRFGGLLGVALLCSAPLGAQEAVPGVLLELYTSQGCSSCPPAEDMLLDLAQRRDVIALALHVDYWDYIGWKDTFASPAYTARQKAYAHAHGARAIYTPQMIVGGHDVIVGAKPMKLGEQLMAHKTAGQAVALAARRSGDRLEISAPVPEQALPADMVVDVVRYLAAATVQITRGENAGLTLEHANIVTDWQRVSDWTGRDPLRLEVQVDGPEPIVVIVQQAGPRRVMAAVRID